MFVPGSSIHDARAYLTRSRSPDACAGLRVFTRIAACFARAPEKESGSATEAQRAPHKQDCVAVSGKVVGNSELGRVWRWAELASL